MAFAPRNILETLQESTRDYYHKQLYEIVIDLLSLMVSNQRKWKDLQYGLLQVTIRHGNYCFFNPVRFSKSISLDYQHLLKGLTNNVHLYFDFVRIRAHYRLLKPSHPLSRDEIHRMFQRTMKIRDIFSVMMREAMQTKSVIFMKYKLGCIPMSCQVLDNRNQIYKYSGRMVNTNQNIEIRVQYRIGKSVTAMKHWWSNMMKFPFAKNFPLFLSYVNKRVHQ